MMSDNKMIMATAEEVKELSKPEAQLESSNTLNVFGNVADFEQAQRFAKALVNSDVIPENYKGSVSNCMIAIDIASRMGLSPLSVMQNLYIVRGKPSWSGQACRALIENDGRYKDIRTVYVGERGQDNWGCYLEAKYTESGELIKGPIVDIAMAKKEGWYSKKDRNGNETSKWQTMPELMLAYRAAAFFARVYRPSAMMGFQTTEEISDTSNAQRVKKAESITADIMEEI